MHIMRQNLSQCSAIALRKGLFGYGQPNIAQTRLLERLSIG
ncbi:hypothetical protein [Yoonia sp. 2307UL14-13]